MLVTEIAKIDREAIQNGYVYLEVCMYVCMYVCIYAYLYSILFPTHVLTVAAKVREIVAQVKAPSVEGE